MKKLLNLLIVFGLLLTLTGCNSGEGESDRKKVAVVINQRFGDNGPMDDLASGVEKAKRDFDIDVKLIESANASKFEEDVRAMAKDGYGLIITTFPYMTDATKLIASEYPETMFSAIFQFINDDKTTIENIWDTEFHGEQAFYIGGNIAGKLTKANKIGLVIGGEEPTPNAEGNAFMRGVKDSNSDADIEFSFIGSYEDPAKAKEIASAMVAKGVDLIMTNSGASNAGVIEVCKESDILCSGEITDYYDQHKGFYGYIGIGFGETAYQAIKTYIDETFDGGNHGIRDLSNGGYFMAWETFERFSQDNKSDYVDMDDIINAAKELEDKIINGEIIIDFDISVPSWNKIKAE